MVRFLRQATFLAHLGMEFLEGEIKAPKSICVRCACTYTGSMSSQIKTKPNTNLLNSAQYAEHVKSGSSAQQVIQNETSHPCLIRFEQSTKFPGPSGCANCSRFATSSPGPLVILLEMDSNLTKYLGHFNTYFQLKTEQLMYSTKSTI